ncbi:MAG: hypothetical protein LBB90_12045 [Tannerella sp.]|jgi:hypothetical protein|nr:hypothetical protein [Tannerella sp.]
MKKSIKKGILLLLASVMLCGVTIATAAGKKKQPWRYEIEVVEVGAQGTYLIKVWSYAKKANDAIAQATRNAVHGVIFKGFTGKPGISGQKALAASPNLEESKKDFFDAFFADGGKYMKFVNITNNGSISAQDRLKVGKEYKIGVIVSVDVSALRKDLEDAGIITRLGAGFAE